MSHIRVVLPAGGSGTRVGYEHVIQCLQLDCHGTLIDGAIMFKSKQKLTAWTLAAFFLPAGFGIPRVFKPTLKSHFIRDGASMSVLPDKRLKVFELPQISERGAIHKTAPNVYIGSMPANQEYLA